MDFFNSPLFVVVFIIIWIPLVWFLNRRSDKDVCGACGKRTMQELDARPEGIIHSTSHTTGLTRVRMRVKYQCLNCREIFVTIENRK